MIDVPLSASEVFLLAQLAKLLGSTNRESRMRVLASLLAFECDIENDALVITLDSWEVIAFGPNTPAEIRLQIAALKEIFRRESVDSLSP